MNAVAILQLLRLPNIFTAMGDVAAGFCIVNGAISFSRPLLALLLCSAALYGAGCVLNDLCDLDLDKKEHPERPLPSGRVSVAGARWLTALLVLLAIGASLVAGMTSFLVAVLLVSCIFLYDRAAKKHLFWGPAAMAGCRALNLALGMSLGAAISKVSFVYPLLSFAYIFCLTVISHFEVSGQPGNFARLPLAGLAAVSLILLGLIGGGRLSPAALPFFAALLFALFPKLIKLTAFSDPPTIRKTVKGMILGIPLLDATYAAGSAGITAGLFICLFFLPAFLIGRKLAMT